MGRTYRALRRNLWNAAARVMELSERPDVTLSQGIGWAAWTNYNNALEACRANGCLDD